MSAVRTGFIAAVVTVALVAWGKPAMADGGPIGGPGGAVCLPGGPSGMTGVSVGFPTSPFSTSLGLTLPDLNPEPIATTAVIAPAAGESFAPITLVEVRAIPTAKVLRAEVVDPDHAVMRWGFTVQQFCPDTGQPETCHYTYHEMPDGSVFEVATLPDGQAFEHAFTIVCQTVHAFRAVGAPQDLGGRLLAAAKANVAPAAVDAKAAAALGAHVEQATNLPAGTLSSAELTAWATATGSVIGLIGIGNIIAGGACGGFFNGLVIAEIGAWTQLLTIPTATPGARTPKAIGAVAAKLTATWFFKVLVPTCLAQMQVPGVGTSLTLFLELLMFLGSAFWWTSTALLLIYGADYAINHWT